MTVDEFITDYCTIRHNASLKGAWLEEYNSILHRLYVMDVIQIDGMCENGLHNITGFSYAFVDGVSDNTLAIFKRQKVDVDYNIDLGDNKLHEQLVVTEGEMSFDSFVALKYLRTKLTAIERGIEFSLSLGDFKRLMSSKRCRYSGVELTLVGDHSVSIDRKDSTIGYTKDNVVVCSKTVNGIKNSLLESRVMTRGIEDRQLKKLLISFSEML